MDASMNDLFTTIEEAADERQAIMEEAGQSAESIAAELFRCEVKWAIRWFYPSGKSADGLKIDEYFSWVEKHRGNEAPEKLRAACREAWKVRKAADSMAGKG